MTIPHELTHVAAAKLLNIPVKQVCLFHVEYPKEIPQNRWVTLAPFFLYSLLLIAYLLIVQSSPNGLILFYLIGQILACHLDLTSALKPPKY